jgi:alpha-L-fucosidase 2
MQYAVRLQAQATGGQVSFLDKTMEVKKADEVVLILKASTNYKLDYPNYPGTDPKQTSLDQLTKASAKPLLLC